MLKFIPVCALLLRVVASEASVSGIKPSNVLGGAEQHASFSFVRPGLTQTSFAFNGPNSHQAFSSSVGNPHLAQKVFPNVAQALAYRNPGLGHFSNTPIATAYGLDAVYSGGILANNLPAIPHQLPLDSTLLAYLQQMQQFPAQLQTQVDPYFNQVQLQRLLALRQIQAQTHQVPEQIQLQRQDQQVNQPQNLLGVAYSSAPSVAHVKVSGNGYKFDF